MARSNSKKQSKKQPETLAAFQQLSLRFFLNLPPEELKSFDRIFFQLNQARWFYEDFLRVENPNLPALPLRKFCELFFHHCELLKPHLEQFEECYARFIKYINSVPVYGCIVLNTQLTKFVLVRGWDAKSWGFPKGKIDHSESDMQCAAREVQEEIGVDVGGLLSAKNRLVGRFGGKEMTLFIAAGVSEETVFQTHTVKEISEIKWFSIKSLMKKASSSKAKTKYWNVLPYLPKLEEWIKAQTKSKAKGTKSKKTKKSKSFPIDERNSLTFGDSQQGWDPNDMFAANEKLKLSSDGSSLNDLESSSEDILEILADGSDRWSVEDMFQLNQDMYGVKSCNISNLDDLSASMAQSGSGYKSYSIEQHINTRLPSAAPVDQPSPLSFHSDSRCSDDHSEFAFDAKSVLQALVSGFD